MSGVEFYDLDTDPWEANNLWGSGFDSEQQAAFDELRKDLANLSGSCWAPSDLDLDCVPDTQDNCMLDENPRKGTAPQCDSDQDGYGNRCDADYNNDGYGGGTPDYNFMGQSLGSSVGDPNYNPDTDMNCDGTVDAFDYDIFQLYYSTGVVGPSGLLCAGITVPCAAVFRVPLLGPVAQGASILILISTAIAFKLRSGEHGGRNH